MNTYIVEYTDFTADGDQTRQLKIQAASLAAAWDIVDASYHELEVDMVYIDNSNGPF